jgi:hypothetical protein
MNTKIMTKWMSRPEVKIELQSCVKCAFTSPLYVFSLLLKVCVRMRAEKKSEEAHAFNVGLGLPRARSLGPKSRLRAERIFLSTYTYIWMRGESGGLSLCEIQIVRISNFHSFRIKLPVEIFLPCVGLEYHLLHLAEHAHLILYKSSKPATDKVSRERCNTISRAAESRAQTRTPYCVCDQKANIM